MCLAQFVGISDVYTDFYKKMKAEGKYVVLDNGEAENMQLTLEALLDKICMIHPSEVILPDTLFDSTATINKSIAAYDALSNKLTTMGIRIMVVPQGKTVEEWFQCAKILIDEIKVDTIGIPKLLVKTENDLYARAKAVSLVRSINMHDIEIHLLGCSETPKIIKAIKETAPNIVRGCDSSFAYLCADAGIDIIESTRRPSGQLDYLNGTYNPRLLQTISGFERACGITDNGSDFGWN